MKKILFFLILLLSTSIITVNAKSYNFFEGSYIPNIYMNRSKDYITYYQQAKFFTQTHSLKPVYCIEPFADFNSTEYYYDSNTVNYLTKEQQERIKLISYYGWQYQHHTDQKWYAISQFMIWQTSYPNATYYFSDTLNGPPVSKFINEMNEINTLIANHNIKPNLDNNLTIKVNSKISIPDSNNVLSNYKVITNNATIENNNLIIENLELGTHNIELEQIMYHKNQSVFYVSGNSQDMIDIGNPDPIKLNITITVQDPTLTLNKIDYDTKTNKPQPNTNLTNSTFEIYKDNILVQTIILKNTTEIIKNLDYGNYYIIEKTPGTGYQLNNNKYYFDITKEQPNPSITIENEVIKKEILITKLYGSKDNFIPEENINFNIYNAKDELIKTIITDHLGKTSIILPYGIYTLKQMTTTEGFEKIKPITINVTDTKTEELTLKNYKINVPDTYNDNQNIFTILWQKLKYLFLSFSIH